MGQDVEEKRKGWKTRVTSCCMMLLTSVKKKAGLNTATRPTGKQAYLNKGRFLMSGWTEQPDLRIDGYWERKKERFGLDKACDVRLNCAT